MSKQRRSTLGGRRWIPVALVVGTIASWYGSPTQAAVENDAFADGEGIYVYQLPLQGGPGSPEGQAGAEDQSQACAKLNPAPSKWALDVAASPANPNGPSAPAAAVINYSFPQNPTTDEVWEGPFYVFKRGTAGVGCDRDDRYTAHTAADGVEVQLDRFEGADITGCNAATGTYYRSVAAGPSFDPVRLMHHIRIPGVTCTNRLTLQTVSFTMEFQLFNPNVVPGDPPVPACAGTLAPPTCALTSDSPPSASDTDGGGTGLMWTEWTGVRYTYP